MNNFDSSLYEDFLINEKPGFEPCVNFALNMRKIRLFVSFLIISFCFFVFPFKAEAKIVTVGKDGEIIINVLASEDSFSLTVPKKESVEVTKLGVGTGGNPEGKISLAKDGNSFKLNIVSAEGERQLDVTNIKGDLIEIEERPKVKNIKIGLLNGKFFIQEGGIQALTEYPINVDPKYAELSIETSSGKHFLAILPSEAYQTSLKAKIVSKLAVNDLIISEKKIGEVAYEIDGKKTLNFFNLLSYDVPVKVSVSALTGEILNVDQPPLLRVLGFIFG